MIGALFFYGRAFAKFAETLSAELAALPEKPDESAAQALDALCESWEKHTLLLHLSVPQGRLDAMQEKLYSLRSFARDRDGTHYRAALSAARGDAEYLMQFETVSLENLI